MILFLSLLGTITTSKHQSTTLASMLWLSEVLRNGKSGHQLNINPEKLSNLFKSGRSGAECRDEMIAYWEKYDNDASWEKLVCALMRMGENQLGDR